MSCRTRRVVRFTLAFALMASAVVGPAIAQGDALHVVTTTNIIADTTRNIAGDVVQVTSLMGPGVDPHLYQPSFGDVQLLASADLILYTGLALEGKMTDILVRMARQIPTVAVTETIDESDLLSPAQFAGLYDPHVWFDARLWMQAALRIRDALIELDPGNEATYRQNAAAYLDSLEDLDAYAQARIAQVPEAQRVLVTAHDAFGYFGKAYGIEVIGLQGISTESEYGLRDVQDLVAMLVERGIGAVFVETSVTARGIQAVVEGAAAQSHRVTIGGNLYSDALGEAGTPEGTYIGAFRHNVDTIAEALLATSD